MAKNVDLGELEKEIREILDNNSIDTTVELSDLSGSTYKSLADFFRKNYEVKGVINILRIGEGERNYVLHLRRK